MSRAALARSMCLNARIPRAVVPTSDRDPGESTIVSHQDPSADPPPARILFIGGLGRSGSTLLSLLLDSLPDFVAVGELRYIWLHLEQNLLCACGAPFRACEFWSAVGDEAFGGWHHVDPRRILTRIVDRYRYLPLLLRPPRLGSFEKRLHEYRAALSRVYEAVSAISGRSVIVDSTKEPPFGLVVRDLTAADFRLVHLVRDSRGVAYSWTKQKQRPEVSDGEAMMNRYGPVSASVRWLGSNVLCHKLVRDDAARIVVRYEELIANPCDVVDQIVHHAGNAVPPDEIAAVVDGRRALSRGHSIAGNPVRFDKRPLRLRLDDAWRSDMPRRDRLVVTALTAPLLRRYGYTLGDHRSA